MPELAKHRNGKTIQPNITVLSGTIEVNGGAIVNQTGQRNSGVTFTRNATGDFRATIHRAYQRVVGGDASVINPTLGTALSLTTGTEAQMQGISSANCLGTSPISTFGIATARPDTGVLIDPPANGIISWFLIVSDSK